jgi:small subunit ribosomal protein S20
MANIKSAEKRVSVSATKKLQNQMVRSQMHTAVKKFNAAISEGDVETAKALLPVAYENNEHLAYLAHFKRRVGGFKLDSRCFRV